MKKKSVVLMIIGIACFMFLQYTYAQEAMSDAILEELKNELQQEGISEEDMDAIKKPIRGMLKQRVNKKGIKDVITNLSKKGIKGKELKASVHSIGNLVKHGEGIKEAGNIVSRAAHKAKAEGLKGDDLAAKVHEAVQQRKQEREALKEQKKEQKQQGKEKKKKRRVITID